MLGLVLNTLRHRKAGFAGAFLALFCAAALVCACGILLETGLRGTIAPERYAGAPVLVTGDQYVHQDKIKKGKVKHKAKTMAERAWLPASTADRLRSVPGVTSVVTEVTFPAEIPGATAAGSLGHGWESAALTPFTLRAGRPPSAADEVVIDAATARAARLGLGARVTIASAATTSAYRVAGVTREALPHQTALFFSTAQARRLAGRPGAVSAIGVFPAAGDRDVADRVTAALRGTSATVHTGTDRGPTEFWDAEKARIKLISMGGALGGTALLVAILVVAGTFALSIQQREREIALLRAVAATPRQIRRMIGREALIVSLGAGALGAAAGPLLGFWLRDRFRSLGALPPTLDLVLSPFPLFAAVLAALAAAWAAARLSARRSARIRPVEALGEAALSRPRTGLSRILAGLAFLTGGVVLTLVLSSLRTEAASSPVTMLTAIVWTVAVALLAPVIARVAAALLGPPLRTSPIGGHLAAANLRSRSRLVGSVIAPLTLMVGLTCTILFAQTTMGHAATAQANTGTIAAHVLGPKVPTAAADAFRRTRGVTTVTEVVHSTVRVGLENYGVQGVTPAGLARTMDLDVRSGSLNGLDAGTIAVSETAAARLGVRVGGQVRMTLGDGTPFAPRVVAVYGRGLGFGDLTVAHDLLAAHVDDPRADAVLVAGPAAADALRSAVRPYPGVAVLDQATVTKNRAAANAEVNYVAMGLIIAFTGIAVVNTLAMATADRTREFALLRLVGTTRRQVMRMLRWETLAVVSTAVILGTVVALVTLTAFAAGMVGSAAPYVPPVTFLAVIGTASALALIATVLPARLALAARPADVIGSRE
ncbi:ABC transporter permease [Actinoallomurus purpureus]|uniref:ABC transporter permease n=1 Tax=Actinoallomurus purpureus TaxID=478114 RepID=UPI00209361F7|nr:FtsX-like permease family protein [Actinoallomurus purpureus]MCO6005478.1 ABC transporter permease [Actinoallomurus purpureus]